MQTQTVFVILTGAAAPSGLARAAIRNGWPILDGPLDTVQLHQALARGRSGVVIVHVPIPHVSALEMIRAFQASWRCAVVIAMGAVESEQDEVLARAAGAGLFLPETADADLIERTVRALAVPEARAVSTTTENRRRTRKAG
jgi:DNA-binding response OmpR family regulator